MTTDWKASISVREAQQELLGASYGNCNKKAYEREYGPYNGDYMGEMGAVGI